jgi:hypothetical protein
MIQQWICDENLRFVHNKPKREKAAHNQVPHNGACIANERNFVAKMSLYKLPEIVEVRLEQVVLSAGRLPPVSLVIFPDRSS